MRVPLLMEEEITEHLARVPGWTRVGEAIAQTYRFAGFRAAIAFVTQVAEAAENADHHPEIDVRYRNVTLRLTTHDSRGLTRLDFELAAVCDALAEGSSQ